MEEEELRVKNYELRNQGQEAEKMSRRAFLGSQFVNSQRGFRVGG
jgi:hypothetical protein